MGMGETGKPDTTPLCPKCGGKLIYDGKGLSCISCPYTWRKGCLEKAVEKGRRADKNKKSHESHPSNVLDPPR